MMQARPGSMATAQQATHVNVNAPMRVQQVSVRTAEAVPAANKRAKKRTRPENCICEPVGHKLIASSPHDIVHHSDARIHMPTIAC